MNTEAHTHRFDDNGTCERCGRSLEDVRAERAAKDAARTPAAERRDDLASTAALNDKKDRAANRRSYYERTGR